LEFAGRTQFNLRTGSSVRPDLLLGGPLEPAISFPQRFSKSFEKNDSLLLAPGSPRLTAIDQLGDDEEKIRNPSWGSLERVERHVVEDPLRNVQ